MSRNIFQIHQEKQDPFFWKMDEQKPNLSPFI